MLVSANFTRRNHLPMAQRTSRDHWPMHSLCTTAIKITTFTTKWAAPRPQENKRKLPIVMNSFRHLHSSPAAYE